MDIYKRAVPQHVQNNKIEFTSKTTLKIYATEKQMKYKKPSVFKTGNLFSMPKHMHIIIFVIKLSKSS